MSRVDSQNRNTLAERLGGERTVREIIDSFYDKILGDYRINRFFNRDNESEQKATLASCINTVFGGKGYSEAELTEVLDEYFMAAFARSKRKSFVAGSDFGFLGMVADQDKPNPHPMCDAHKALLKFLPDDNHYDVVLEHLDATLSQLNVEKKLATEVLEIAAEARDRVLGK